MVAGKYAATGKAMGKEMECHLDYRVDGNVLTGTMDIKGNKIEVMEGTVDGDNFKHKCQLATPMGKMAVTIEGSVNGDEISFILKNAFAKTQFTGHRE